MPHIAFDTETWLIQPGRLAPRLVCLSWADGHGGKGLFTADDGCAAFRKWIDDGYMLVGHNVAYDLAVICQHDPSLIHLVFAALDVGQIGDTMILELLRRIEHGQLHFDPKTGKRPGFSLAALAQNHIGKTLTGKSGSDAWRLRYHELDGMPLAQWPDAARDYAITDAVTTLAVWKEIRRTYTSEDLEAQCRAAFALHLMAAWGLKTDKDAVEKLDISLTQTVTDAVETLKKSGIYRDDGTKNTKHVQQLVNTAYDGSPPKTVKGAISTATATLEESGDPLLEQLAAISSDQKLLSTFVPLLKEGTEYPLNPRYNVLVASGRTSCSKPNVQNLPRRGGIRECFVPRPGKVFIACDYHIAELCSLAQILVDQYGESKMAEALQAGRELHLETAAGILGINYDEAVARHKKGDKEVKEARQLSKALNFGLPGGLGAETFKTYAKASYGVEVSSERAKELKEQWLERYPEMRGYFRDIGLKLQGGDDVMIQNRSNRKRGGIGFCDGANTLFQGLTADGAKAALYAVAKECYAVPSSALFGTRPVAFVHDEIIVEANEASAGAAAIRLSEVMIAAMKRYLPDIPVKADAALMRRWYKDAEPVFDNKGNLEVWKP